MATQFDPHPDRSVLLDELHARPRPPVSAPCAITRVDLQVEADEAIIHADRLTERVGMAQNARHHIYEDGARQVIFERRTEFVSYTLIDAAPSETPFSDEPFDPVLDQAFEDLPGQLVSAVRVHLFQSDDGAMDHALCRKVFGRADFAASAIRGGDASLASDFRPDESGFIRFLVFDSTAVEAVRGRMVQRILELEAYRMAAMLALPVARSAGGELDRLDAALAEVSDRIAAGAHAAKDRDILQRLTRLAGVAERLRAAGDYRFAAARAYGDLVNDRILRLREERVEGHERVGVFIGRRLNPALRTCQSVSERQQAVAQRVDRAVRLLTTRVQVEMEDKNASLLDAMNQRAAAQLKLQEAVEALSTVAITYYGVGLIHYLAKGAAEMGWPINPALVAGVATPLIFFGILFGIRSVRSWITGRGASPRR